MFLAILVRVQVGGAIYLHELIWGSRWEMQTLLARDVQRCLGLALPVSQGRREPEEQAW